MLESLRQTLCIWIDRRETVLVLRKGWLRRSARVLGRFPHAATTEHGLSLDGLREGIKEAVLGIAAQVVVQDDAVRMWPVDAPAKRQPQGRSGRRVRDAI